MHTMQYSLENMSYTTHTTYAESTHARHYGVLRHYYYCYYYEPDGYVVRQKNKNKNKKTKTKKWGPKKAVLILIIICIMVLHENENDAVKETKPKKKQETEHCMIWFLFSHFEFCKLFY